MRKCDSCEQQNPDDAKFCHGCGVPFSEEPVASPSVDVEDDEHLWETFIGDNPTVHFSPSHGWAWRPAALYYLSKFAKFRTARGPKFELSWNWAAFLFDFLWFLYRKMYLFALLYAVGPFLALYLTGIPTIGVVWKIMAAVSANYLYFWHVKDHLQKLKTQGLVDQTSQEGFLKEEGGVQPYVIWLGALLMLFGVLFSDQYMDMYGDGVPVEQLERSTHDPQVHLEE